MFQVFIPMAMNVDMKMSAGIGKGEPYNQWGTDKPIKTSGQNLYGLTFQT